MYLPTLSWDDGRLKLIDQTKLPLELEYIYCSSAESVWEAIKMLRVRGAPAIGIAGAFGVVVGMQGSSATGRAEFTKELSEIIGYLSTVRPTAVNLSWALERMRTACAAEGNVGELKNILLKEALSILEEDKDICRRIGRNGAELLKDGDTVLTHCNAGSLATADFGTALGVIYSAVEEGKTVKVYACETRPLLQGARLTTWELMRSGVDVTLICDNTAGKIMREGRIDAVIVGADRIASNGDTANKVGTYTIARLASAHNVPFCVAAPVSTLDLTLAEGGMIPIEERDPEEVTHLYGKRIAPEGVKVHCPAFDVTPGGLISAIISENGVVRPPYEKTLREAMVRVGNRYESE